ncbi:MAG: lactonase family protein [Chloroflexota bacterium]
MLVYVGTYTKGNSTSEGIYVYALDPKSGVLTHRHTIRGPVNPSFLALDPSQQHLYAVSERQDAAGAAGGGVSAFRVDQTTGNLTALNQQSSGGAGPCHVSVEATGKFALVANFGSGSIAMLPIQSDGALAPASDFVQHVGSSAHPQRQHSAHAHSINPDPDNRFALVADLGMDRVLVYRLDLAEGKLRPHDHPWSQARAGAGPRHLAYHPNGRFVYVINEIDSTMGAYAFDAGAGTLTEIQTLSTLPEGYTEDNSTADVHLSPSGRFLYGSNRGHDSIAVFAVDADTGRLIARGHVSTQGRTPRNFGIDPTGMFLLAANQATDTIVSFRLNPDSGMPEPTGAVAPVPRPVCLKFGALGG